MTQKISYSGLKIALYQPDIPQNTAAIVRTCSCLGVQPVSYTHLTLPTKA